MLVEPTWNQNYSDSTTASMASLDVKTAFDVTKPSVASKIFPLSGVHGHLVAGLLAEMKDVTGSIRLLPEL